MQALDLPPLLSAFGADHLISSPWTRCVQTVGPYSSIARLDVKLNKKLTEDSVAANPQASSALVEKLLKKDRGVYVVSHHSPGLPPLLEPLIRGAGSKRYPVLSSPHKGLRTSEMFIAHIAHPLGEGPKVLNIERHIPYTRLAGH